MEQLEAAVRQTNREKKSGKKTNSKKNFLDREAAEDDSDDEGRSINFSDSSYD